MVLNMNPTLSSKAIHAISIKKKKLYGILNIIYNNKKIESFLFGKTPYLLVPWKQHLIGKSIRNKTKYKQYLVVYKTPY